MNFAVALRRCAKCTSVDTSQIARSGITGLPFWTQNSLSRPQAQIRFSSFYSPKVAFWPPLRGSRCQNNALHQQIRRMSKNSNPNSTSYKNRSTLLYFSGATILVLGLSYAAVPLYRIFCQATNYGGQVNVSQLESAKLEDMKKVSNRILTVRFNADLASSLAWNFKPQQTEILLAPGETALAFYTATNSTDRPVTGIATYNVVPFEAGPYFNKIQCFCFEEQRLNPHEQVDMPVFFYIDPEWIHDPKLENVDTLTLSYTFFEAKEGFTLPIPSYAKR